MAELDAVNESLEALATFTIGEASMADTLHRVTELSARALPPVKYTGITMLADGQVTTSVFSDPDVCEIDEAQYSAGRGPCLDSYRSGEVNAIESTATDERWPEFSRAAAAHGVGSTLSLPLLAGDRSMGALNLYAEGEGAFGEEERAIAGRFAAQAAVVLANSQTYAETRDLADNLGEALKSRATIEQAKGILMAQSPMDPDRAFDLLRAASQRENRKLRDIAQELVDRHKG